MDILLKYNIYHPLTSEFLAHSSKNKSIVYDHNLHNNAIFNKSVLKLIVIVDIHRSNVRKLTRVFKLEWV